VERPGPLEPLESEVELTPIRRHLRDLKGHVLRELSRQRLDCGVGLRATTERVVGQRLTGQTPPLIPSCAAASRASSSLPFASRIRQRRYFWPVASGRSCGSSVPGGSGSRFRMSESLRRAPRHPPVRPRQRSYLTFPRRASETWGSCGAGRSWGRSRASPS
jgi:hypothetical protein